MIIIITKTTIAFKILTRRITREKLLTIRIIGSIKISIIVVKN